MCINQIRVKLLIMAMLLVPVATLTGCLVTVDSDSRSVSRVWDEQEVSSLDKGLSDHESVRKAFGEPLS